MSLVVYRHFCAALRVLEVYENCGTDFLTLPRDIRRAIKLGLRTEDVEIPDHQHESRVQYAFARCNSLAEMLLAALGGKENFAGDDMAEGRNAAHGLEIRHGHIYVHKEHLEAWQREVAAYQSPVPVLAACWERHCHAHSIDDQKGMALVCNTLRYSSLPSIFDRHLHGIIQSSTGVQGNLCDLHVHINGSTEFAHVWNHSLCNVGKTYKSIEDTLSNGAVKNKLLYFHEQLRTTCHKINVRMHLAKLLRQYICRWIASDSPPLSLWDFHHLLHGTLRSDAYIHNGRHPFTHDGLPCDVHDLQREGAMWYMALRMLRKNSNVLFAALVHTYMLLMHQHLRLLVQQKDQYGFDQFQYITLAGGRDAAESEQYRQRFLQFHGMYGPDLHHVEGRFSPKKDAPGNIKLLKNIWSGYRKAHAATQRGAVEPCPACPLVSKAVVVHQGSVFLKDAVASPAREVPPTLSLVAHFIKEADTKNASNCRHRKLRDSVMEKAKGLVAARKRLQRCEPALANAIAGKDAASNELDTPPEVFASTFRYLHHEGITHTTYHAGEDFHHILCGMRAVHEALTFLNMHSGDRIGHATALGLSPHLCPAQTYCPQGVWLDTLVWLALLVEKKPLLRPFAGEISRLHSSMESLYFNIYGDRCESLTVLWNAWKLRRFDMNAVNRFLNAEESTTSITGHTKRELAAIEEEKSRLGDKNFKAAVMEYKKYHRSAFAKAYAQPILLEEYIQPGTEFVLCVQDAIIQEMNQKNILVEVLPTSNVRISHYNSTDEHHIMRWLNHDDVRPAPLVVLGTDDPGIFSTTLRNEYALILRKLQAMHQSRSDVPYATVRHLMENSKNYRFGSTRSGSPAKTCGM